MFPLRQSFLFHRSARWARLTRFLAVHSEYLATSTLSLVRQHPKERSPTCIVDLLGSNSFSESFDVEILYDDSSKLMH